MSDTKKLTGIVGQPIQVMLQSHVASTGFGWYLTELDGGLGLWTSCTHPTSDVPGAIVNHAFDFLCLKAGTFKVVFQLIAPWRPAEPAQTEVYEIDIKEPLKAPMDDLEAAMSADDFVGPEATVLKYAAPSAPSVKYAAPVLKYAAPVMKYAAPPMMPEYAAPSACMIYAVPPTLPPMAMPYAAPWTSGPVQQAAAAGPAPAAPEHLPCPPYRYTHPDPRVTDPPIVILYAAPVTSPGHMHPLYAAPSTGPFPYPPVVLYAAPMTARPGMAGMPAMMPYPHPIPMYMAPYNPQPLSQAADAGASASGPMPLMPPYAAPMPGWPHYPPYPLPMYMAPYMAPYTPPAPAAPSASASGPMIPPFAPPIPYPYPVYAAPSAMIPPYAAPYTGGGCC